MTYPLVFTQFTTFGGKRKGYNDKQSHFSENGDAQTKHILYKLG